MVCAGVMSWVVQKNLTHLDYRSRYSHSNLNVAMSTFSGKVSTHVVSQLFVKYKLNYILDLYIGQ